MKKPYALIAILGFMSAMSCGDDITEITQVIENDTTVTVTNDIINYIGDTSMFQNKSNLTPLVTFSPQFSFVKAYSLISSTDDLNGFRMAGAPDGAGFIKDGDNFIYVVNMEDHYAVSRITMDKNLNPVKGDYLLNSGVADFARQCSGTMWEKEIHGGASDLFLSASESGSGIVKGIDPRVATPTPTADFNLPALGAFYWENAVPLPKNAYSGKTVIIGGDDDSSDSEGQVIMYLSESSDDDLTGGEVFVLRLKDAVAPVNEGSLDFGAEYDVEFVQVSADGVSTPDEYEQASLDANALQFMRVEDVDYGKGSDAAARTVFFAVTGRGPGRGTYNDWGTIYRLDLDATNPKVGLFKQIVSGNTDTNHADGKLPRLHSPDTICVTENFVYFQEDPNSFSRGHAAYIYQTNYNGDNPRMVLELIERADLSPEKSIDHSGEFGSLIDISDKVGVEDVFMLALQPHYWTSDDFKGLDGHTSSVYEHDEGGQILIIKGLPR